MQPDDILSQSLALKSVSRELNLPDREKRRRALFEAGLRLPERERTAFIERQTAGDPDLRDSVLRLIRASSAHSTGALDRPVYQRPPAPAAAARPRKIGGYTVIKPLGSGGMASVYACRAPDGTVVAVKLLNAALHDPHFLRRFEEERDIQMRIRHPNVCQIFHGGAAEHGTPFIAMELVEGQPIDRYCASKRLSARERLRLFSQVLAGVEYCHRREIVHRDLKPSNVLVTAAGQVKILDFGIAKIAAHRSGMTGHGPTHSALRLMTIRYASPEQLQQRLSGRSSDIYALGVMLYELIAGRHPYWEHLESGTERLLVAMNASLPSPPSALAASPDLPAGLDQLVLRALHFDPAQRYQLAGQFLEAVGRCLEGDAPHRLPAHSG